MPDEAVPTVTPDTTTHTPDAGGGAPPPSETRQTLREQLADNFDKAKKDDPDDRGDGRTPRGRFTRKVEAPETPPVEAGGTLPAPDDKGTPADSAVTPAAAAPDDKAPVAGEPPKDWPKDATEVWNQLSPAAQAVVAKRLDDSAKGVDKIRTQYKEIDDALTPHLPAIRQHGHTPAQAVTQLFAWFQALAGNPDKAFPALAQSFNYDLNKIAGTVPPKPAPAAAADPALQTPEGGAAPLPDVSSFIRPLESRLDELGQGFSGILDYVHRQRMEKTQDVLTMWAKDKPHYAEVRGLMAQLIQSGAVPLKEGQVDLDGAYDAAIWAHPEVRTKVMAERKTAEDTRLKAEEEQKRNAEAARATAARGAAVSVRTTAPSGPAGRGATPNTRGKTVRESLDAAVAAARTGT